VEEQKSLTKSGKREMRRKTGSREGEKRKPYKILSSSTTPSPLAKLINQFTR